MGRRTSYRAILALSTILVTTTGFAAAQTIEAATQHAAKNSAENPASLHFAQSPAIPANFVIEQRSDQKSAAAGDYVSYTVAVRSQNKASGPAFLSSELPDGFSIVEGTVQLNGEFTSDILAVQSGNSLTFDLSRVATKGDFELKYALRIDETTTAGRADNRIVVLGKDESVQSNISVSSLDLRNIQSATTGLIAGQIQFTNCGDALLAENGETSGVNLEGILISLDNGETVMTSKNGQFFFDNVALGQHSVSIDQASVPAGLAMKSCGASTKGQSSHAKTINLSGSGFLNVDLYFAPVELKTAPQAVSTPEAIETPEAQEHVAEPANVPVSASESRPKAEEPMQNAPVKETPAEQPAEIAIPMARLRGATVSQPLAPQIEVSAPVQAAASPPLRRTLPLDAETTPAENLYWVEPSLAFEPDISMDLTFAENIGEDEILSGPEMPIPAPSFGPVAGAIKAAKLRTPAKNIKARATKAMPAREIEQATVLEAALEPQTYLQMPVPNPAATPVHENETMPAPSIDDMAKEPVSHSSVKEQELQITQQTAESDPFAAQDEFTVDAQQTVFLLSSFEVDPRSEHVTIVSRDKSDSAKIVSTRKLMRDIDYWANSRDGTIILRRPVLAQDPDQNPNMVVINYRTPKRELPSTQFASTVQPEALKESPKDSYAASVRRAAVLSKLRRRHHTILSGGILASELPAQTLYGVDATPGMFTSNNLRLHITDGTQYRHRENMITARRVALMDRSHMRTQAAEQRGFGEVETNHNQQASLLTKQPQTILLASAK